MYLYTRHGLQCTTWTSIHDMGYSTHYGLLFTTCATLLGKGYYTRHGRLHTTRATVHDMYYFNPLQSSKNVKITIILYRFGKMKPGLREYDIPESKGMIRVQTIIGGKRFIITIFGSKIQKVYPFSSHDFNK